MGNGQLCTVQGSSEFVKKNFSLSFSLFALFIQLRSFFSNLVQVIFPLLQGVLWGMAGIYLNGLWEWNKSRLAAKDSIKGFRRTSSGPGLLSRLGLGV